MRFRLLLITSVAGLLIFPGTAALAKPPSTPPANDTISGATQITSLPFSTSEDTTQATTDAQDAAVNANCGAPATDASVWFSYTPSSDASFIVDVSGSTYSAGLIVADGTPGSLNLDSCGPGSVIFSATGGTTYYILAFDDQTDGSGNGGTLNLTMDVAPPPPTVSMTVNPNGRFDHSGDAIISGTVTCTGADLQFSDLNAYVTQNVGRIGTVQGYGDTSFDCDGVTHTWSMIVFPQSGKFAGGKAKVQADAFACNFTGCGDAPVTQTVSLRSK